MAGATVDPRVERSRRLICEAAVEELAEVGYGAMTIESIARRAGVGKATVYRHWQGKLDLIESALDLLKQDVEVPAEGTIRERITVLLGSIATYLADPTASRCMPAIVSASTYDDAVRTFHHRFSGQRRQVVVDLVEEGIDNGELSADLDPRLVAEALVGPLFYRRLMSPDTFPPERVGEIVDLVLG